MAQGRRAETAAGHGRRGRPRIDLISKLDVHERLSGHQRGTSHDSPAHTLRRGSDRFQLRWIWGSRRVPPCGPRPLSQWATMAEQQLQLDPRVEEADGRASTDLARSLRPPVFRASATRRFAPRAATRDQATQEEIPEGRSAPSDLPSGCDLPPHPRARGRRFGGDRGPDRRAAPGRRCSQPRCPAGAPVGARGRKAHGTVRPRRAPDQKDDARRGPRPVLGCDALRAPDLARWGADRRWPLRPRPSGWGLGAVVREHGHHSRPRQAPGQGIIGRRAMPGTGRRRHRGLDHAPVQRGAGPEGAGRRAGAARAGARHERRRRAQRRQGPRHERPRRPQRRQPGALAHGGADRASDRRAARRDLR